MIPCFVKFCVLFSAFFVIEGTLTPDGTVSLDCGRQQTFTCNVTGVAALWIINGLSGISDTRNTGQEAAMDPRVTTTDSSVTLSSTITITGFTTADNGGTIQCIDLAGPSDQGVANISVEPPSCPTHFSVNRDGEFTSATVTYQLATPPPVTSTTVTYCSTSSPNCGNMTCTSPCTISGLDPCVEYNMSAIPTNNCDSPTGCTSTVLASQGVPSCAEVMSLQSGTGIVCSVDLMWQQPPTPPPVTSTTVTYCPTSSPNCTNSVNCTSPCTISGLDPGTEYKFTVIPNNNCGGATGCTGNTTTTPSDCIPIPPLPIWVIVIIVIVVIIILIAIVIAIVFIVICCCCAAVSAWLKATCCCCCKQANKNRNNPERFDKPPDEYADPKKVREKKEEKIQYAALEFSEQAGSSGEKPIRSKEEPVQYIAVEQA